MEASWPTRRVVLSKSAIIALGRVQSTCAPPSPLGSAYRLFWRSLSWQSHCLSPSESRPRRPSKFAILFTALELLRGLSAIGKLTSGLPVIQELTRYPRSAAVSLISRRTSGQDPPQLIHFGYSDERRRCGNSSR